MGVAAVPIHQLYAVCSGLFTSLSMRCNVSLIMLDLRGAGGITSCGHMGVAAISVHQLYVVCSGIITSLSMRCNVSLIMLDLQACSGLIIEFNY